MIDRDNIAKNVALLTLFRSDIKNWQTNESTREYFYEQPKRKYFPILQYYIFSLIVKMHWTILERRIRLIVHYRLTVKIFNACILFNVLKNTINLKLLVFSALNV